MKKDVELASKNEKKIEKNLESSGRVHYVIIAFVRTMLVVAGMGAYFYQRWLVLFVAILALVVTFMPRILEKKFGLKIPGELEVMVLLFIYGALFLGEIRGFYAAFWWWDVLLNMAASLALGFVGLTVMYVLYKDDHIDASPFVVAVFAFGFAVAAGTMWELFEFIVDSAFGFGLQNASLADTMGDLLVNVIGALFVSTGGYFYMKYGEKNLISKFLIGIIESNPKMFRGKKMEGEGEKIFKLIKKGENNKLEFKETLRTNLHTNNVDRKMEHSVLKTIVAYLNTAGGTLLVGVSDKGKIGGVEKDNFQNMDKMALHFTNLVKHNIGNSYSPFIGFEVVKVGRKHVLRVDCLGSNKPVFLRMDGNEEFFVRNGPSSVKLGGSNLIDYVERRWGKN